MRRGVYGLALAGLMTAGATATWATNGMDLEGYGPIAFGMGGASLAIENGTAAMINNPATLSLMQDGANRVDIALGFLGPDVKSSMPGMPDAHSSADAYFMPAFGIVARRGAWTYGLGVFGQGGMGTDYSDSSFLALNSGDEVSSEVSVGRVIFPVAYQVNEKFAIGGTLDFLWGGMDLKMAMPASQGMSMIVGQPSLALPPLGESDYMRVDFADDSQFTGSATGYGVDCKVGALYKVTDAVRIGAVYHAQPELHTLTSDSAELSFGSMMTGEQGGLLTGKIDIEDFRWPAMAGAGVACDLTENLTCAFDVRYIFWSDVMDAMQMTFKADGGGYVSMALPQNWDDQAVYMIGLQYAATDALTLRAGYNYGENPVPDELVNPLFPAIVEQHFTAGAGLVVKENNELNAAVSVAPENTVDTPSGISISHGQVSAQLMFTHLF